MGEKVVKYVEAPDEFTTDTKSLFLAGGITGCPNWQHQVVSKLLFTDLTLFNPQGEDGMPGSRVTLVRGGKATRRF